MLWTSLLFLAVSPLVHSSVLPVARNAHHGHDHVEERALPGTWFHRRDHPAHNLFKRDGTDDGVTRPAVGTPEWAAPYPTGMPDVTQLPTEWVAALNASLAAGKIPNIAPSQDNGNNSPTYAPGINPNSPDICSATYKCVIPGDIWNAPDGIFASSFDDGPYPTTPQLVDFLTSQNLTTTHFMIGINILNNPVPFQYALDANGDIAVHTWNHKYTTTMDNLEVLGQLGWTMQIIFDSTGGRVPRYWRPPYGDSDVRVSAIAREVFGLQTVVWNNDSEDWQIGTNGVTLQSVEASLQQFITGPKSPGLIILEHEINADFINAFITSFPLIGDNGWKIQSLVTAVGDGAYLNAPTSLTGTVEKAALLDGGDSPTTTSSAAPSSTSATEAPASTNAGQAGASTKASVSTSSAISARQPYLLTMVVSLFGLAAGSLL